ncbi:MAG: hypothetical protein IT433_07080 [Phycisphaerales bacterium]|nr:hypothetical protein [Phycisphaerales bacterium]
MRKIHGFIAVTAALSAIAGLASAQPTITALGSATPVRMTNSIGGTYFVGANGGANGSPVRYSLSGSTLTQIDIGGTGGGGQISADSLFMTGNWLNDGTIFPRIFGNTATSVTPAFNPNPTLVPSTTQPAATEFSGRRWSAASGTWNPIPGLSIDGSLIAFGSSSSGGSTGNFLSPNHISATGQFVVGIGYVCTYNTAGTAVSANSFRWRPWIWDASTGTTTVLPTPFKTTTGQTSLRRTGNAYAVSSDGLVVAGATEHNASTSPSADADGGRFCVWMRPSVNDPFVMTYLDTGVDGNGFPKYISSTPSALAMNSAGTIIAARGPDGITKWVWNGSSWGAPIVLGDNLTVQASWLPAAVTSCNIPPNIGSIICMSEDGNLIGGSATYSTCGSFMSGGFIWTPADGGTITDWYDYNVALGTPNVGPNMFWGPIGDNGDPTRGLPVIGNPTAISPDGSAISGFQGGTQRIVGAPPWIFQYSGGPACVAPTIVNQPAATTNYSTCTSSIILGITAAGTPAFTYQWYKDGNPLSDGLTPSGSTLVGATSFQFRINPPLSPSDAGTYHCVITGQCGSPVTSTNAVVQLDPAFPQAANDTCATATPVAQGTNVLGTGQGVCGALVNDPVLQSSCVTSATKADLWYSFTPTTTGDYRLETCGANVDTVLSVYDGCNGSELACNNDYTTGTAASCSATRSRIASFGMIANETYKIRVSVGSSTFLSSSSTYNLSINPAPAPAPNDNCGTPTDIGIGATNFDLAETTTDFVASCQPSNGSIRDMWFRFVPECDGVFTIQTCGSAMSNPILSVMDECGGNELACNDNVGSGQTGCTSNQARIQNVLVRAASPVLIRVAASGTTVPNPSNGTLTIIKTDCLPDFNEDGNTDQDDVVYLINVVSGGENPSGANPDFNCDGNVDQDDVSALINTVGGGGCP